MAFVAIGLQRGMDALLSVGAGRVDLVIIAGAFSATCFPKSSGPLAAMVIGLAYDFSGAGPIGLFGAALGLGGLVASMLPANRWGRMLTAIIAGVIVACVTAWLLGSLRSALGADSAGGGMGGVVATISLTSLMAIAVSLPLWKWRRFFVVEAPRF